ncbi:MAG: hypothetical protein ACYDH9_13520 [Limisphaerales bacterium]
MFQPSRLLFGSTRWTVLENESAGEQQVSYRSPFRRSRRPWRQQRVYSRGVATPLELLADCVSFGTVNVKFEQIMRILFVIVVWIFAASANAMDRWSALSMIESGDRDNARGRAGELSRFQIKPAEWRRSVAGARVSPANPQIALAVAQRIMAKRSAVFERTHRRAPTDFEFYVLWNAPAQVNRPSRVVAKRARRYCNLVARGAPAERGAQAVERYDARRVSREQPAARLLMPNQSARRTTATDRV